VNAVALTLWVSTFASFSWGVLYFFRRRGRMNARTATVAVAGAGFAAWHAAAIAAASAPAFGHALGSVAIAAGGGLFWWAVRACGGRPLTAIGEDDLPVHLVRTGAYRFIRHPFYAAYTLFWFGGALASWSWGSLTSALVMLGLYLQAMRAEEAKFEASALAGEYRAYRRAAGLMWPKRWPTRPKRR
jgi:protein-S-isoprenylcysteine O-methyltransferase Ste14